MSETSKAIARANEDSRSLPIAAKGVTTARDFANLMSCLMSDLIEGKVGPEIANAVCNAGGKMLKVVEMQHKYGGKTGDLDKKSLVLAEIE